MVMNKRLPRNLRLNRHEREPFLYTARHRFDSWDTEYSILELLALSGGPVRDSMTRTVMRLDFARVIFLPPIS
jgi:hypothetical protein